MIVAFAFCLIAAPVVLLLVNAMNLRQARQAVRVRVRDKDRRG